MPISRTIWATINAASGSLRGCHVGALVKTAGAMTPSEVRDVDLLILATKTHDTASALAGIRLSRPPLAFSVQNGVQKNIDLANDL
jgi:hypothetical protein